MVLESGTVIHQGERSGTVEIHDADDFVSNFEYCCNKVKEQADGLLLNFDLTEDPSVNTQGLRTFPQHPDRGISGAVGSLYLTQQTLPCPRIRRRDWRNCRRRGNLRLQECFLIIR